MQLDIITPDKQVFSGEANGVKVPGANGSFEILNNHAPIVSTLEQGDVRVSSKKGETIFKIDGGILEMLDNKITILAESILEG